MRKALIAPIIILAAGFTAAAQEIPFPAQVDFSVLPGVRVESSDGVMKGVVSDAVVAGDNSVPYLVVAFPESPESPDVLYLLPTSILKPGPDGTSIVVDLPPVVAAMLPTLDENLITAGNPDWDRNAREFWSRNLDTDLPEEIRDPVRATRLLSFSVVSTEGRELGVIEDLNIDTGSVRVVFYRLAFDRSLGSGEIVVPVERVERLPGTRQLVVPDSVFQPRLDRSEG